MNKKIGKRVAAARKASHMTQEQLAEKLNISVSAISRLETGRTILSLEHLLEVATALNVGLQDLLCDLFIYTSEDRSVSRELDIQLSQMSIQDKQHLLKYIKLMNEWDE